uniref:sushi domain-containing protein 1-like n=1 Tax=Myxine glutinosa TaxID=7769 RepID=UPI0035900A2E
MFSWQENVHTPHWGMGEAEITMIHIWEEELMATSSTENLSDSHKMAGPRWKLLAFLTIACSGEDSTDPCDLCHKYAECNGHGLSQECVCKRGFNGNGVTLCVDENECLLPPEFLCGLQANCTNTFGGYYCTCLRGYVSTNRKLEFQPNDGTICVDVDECLENLTVCGDGGHCSNTLGSYGCSCLSGYKMIRSGLIHPIENETFCIDIDECLENMTTCKNGSRCSNSPGSFSCSEPLSHSPKLPPHNTTYGADGDVNGCKDVTVLLTIIFSTLVIVSFLACFAFFRSLKTKRKSCVAEST